MWLEITGKCQLECVQCYAESGPAGDHGEMSEADWCHVIDQAVGIGARMVQFIGGEPTLHPSLPVLIEHARHRDVEVEVFSNLVHIRPALWEVLAQPGVRLATSYYSTDPGEHAEITRRPTYERTKANIHEAIRRSIPLRVGVVNLWDGQRSDQAVAELRELGVTEIGIDHLRQVGRGVRTGQAGLDQLCGHCGDGKIAVSPTGEVWPCVFSRWMPMGNVRDRALTEILDGPQMAETGAALRVHFDARRAPCVPDMCDPQCGPSCSPACVPANNCLPVGACAPDYRR
ncbi:radical SAM/SPASM domain-containing protein [Saccharopolyspora hattusasensis]|uniref:radical SAM/SPASM domain-containing protein n=1 Tax=Saccharopolyspora hattusasensis TaxID=1128679 RepID=UPI003D96D6F0